MSFNSCSVSSYSSLSDKILNTNFPAIGLNKEQLLERTLMSLESERDDLVSTVSDLRQLIKRISQQQEKEALRKQKLHEEYQLQIESLRLALQVSENHSGHFATTTEFWKEFIN